MRIFYDTEFLEDGRTIDLISIGMVADDDREFYAINRDAPWDRIRDHSWLMAHVVPNLPGAGTAGASLIDLDDPVVLPREAIADQALAFIRKTPDAELWAWYGAYDHVALCQLYGPMIDLPAGIPMWTHELQQAIDRASGVTLPLSPDGEHHALVDARYARAIAERLRTWPRR